MATLKERRKKLEEAKKAAEKKSHSVYGVARTIKARRELMEGYRDEDKKRQSRKPRK